VSEHSEARRPSGDGGSVTLIDLIGLVRRLWRFWLGGVLAGLAVAACVAFLSKPVYRASTTVVPVSAAEAGGALAKLAGQFGGLASIAGINMNGSQDRDESVALLKSRSFAERFILDEDLLPILFADKWDPSSNSWRETRPDKVPTLWDAWLKFDRKIRTLIEDRDRGLVTLRIEWVDPEVAARWANVLIERANSELRTRKLAEIDRNLGYLQKELDRATLVELRQAIAKVMESQINERMIASSREEYAFRALDPARAPDLDRPEFPKKALLIVLGAVAGGLIGFALGLLRVYMQRARGEL
jgi:uncharacterized protein involved in exopolysaccharide biosynthesis